MHPGYWVGYAVLSSAADLMEGKYCLVRQTSWESETARVDLILQD